MSIHSLPKDYSKVLLKGLAYLDLCGHKFYDDNTPRVRHVTLLTCKFACVFINFISIGLVAVNFLSGSMEFNDFTRVIPGCGACILGFERMALLIFRKEDIKVIIKRLGDVWGSANLTEEQIEKKNVLLKRLDWRFSAFEMFSLMGTWQYMILPILEVLIRRYILNQEFGLLLPVTCVYPFDHTKDWLTYLAVYVFQVITLVYTIYCYIGSEVIVFTLASHLSTQFSLLQMELINLNPEYNKNHDEDDIHRLANTDDDMKDLIRRHQELICLSTDLDDCFNTSIYINMTMTTIMICFLSLSFIFSKTASDYVSNTFPIIGLSYPIYNISFHSELLKESSLEMGDAAYNNLWYNGNQTHKQAINLIIARSQNPCYLTALKYKKVALNTFVSVMSTTWSYISVIMNMKQEQ